MSLGSWIKGLFQKNTIEEEQEAVPVRPSSSAEIKDYVVGLCEQMIEVSKELEEIRGEYDKVTAYLNDIQIVEGMEGAHREQLLDIATNIANLSKTRNEYMNIKQNISDAVYMQMQEAEAEIPDAIRRLKANEAYLDTIRKDMNYLEGEKVEWSVLRHERKAERAKLKQLAIDSIFAFGGIALIMLILMIVQKWDSMLPIIVVAFLATLSGSYIVLRIQECNKDIKKCDVNQNRAIYLENKVKIKFVNMKNAVDYVCQKYHVNNSEELTYNYEQFIEISKEREKLKETNEDLNFYSHKLVRLLMQYNLYDAKVWQNHANAIINPKDMVELKHDLFLRRQKLRERMEYNVNAIDEMKRDARHYCDSMEGRNPQIQAFLSKIDEISKIYS